MQNPLEYNTQRELYGIRVSRLDLDPAGWNRLFFQRMMSISLCSPLNFGELREICYIRVVPSLTLGPVWLFLVVANRADLAVLAQDLGEMRGICLVRCQFLLLAGPGKTPLPVRIARNLRHSRLSLANGAKFAQFASNSFYLSAKD